MRKLLFTAYIWLSYLAFGIFIIYFSRIPDLATKHNYSAALESVTYFFAFGFSSLLFFRAVVYTLKFSVDRLSKARNQKERAEDAEFRLIVETLLVFLTITTSTSLVLVNHIILRETAGRESDIYAILINILGVSIFSLVCYVWPMIGRAEHDIAKKLFG
ncbi:hypothetical protein JW978_01845 [Candidatus Dojkabacteria bacterium]|nr:hypothetical protein [Candidatus Dojkabacteria bacterium]